ncbi:MAG: hypothetical protein K0S07_840 [Chlamydiales bacterium]|jgi:hypothetical protein|nr:hypothetical protein [Chlamydiales bacterium]
MLKTLALLLSLFLPLAASAQASETASIEIHNRVLARINGKVISVLDVMKNLEIVFFEQYPQHQHSQEARYEFFRQHWRQCLNEIISRELVLADAESLKVQVTSGDVRQDLQARFGPNVMANIEKMQLTYEDVFEYVKTDITLRQVMGGRVNSQVMQSVTPKDVRDYYQSYLENLGRKKQWVYQVVTIRSPNMQQSEKVAQLAHRLLTEEHIPLDRLKETLAREKANARVSISQTLRQDEGMLSSAYKQALQPLSEKSYSAPLLIKGRSDTQPVYRIFYLDAYFKEQELSFEDMEPSLRQELTSQKIAEKTAEYLERLKQQFDFEDLSQAKDLPQQFEPFQLNSI